MSLRCALILTITCVATASGQSIPTLKQGHGRDPRAAKAENGLIISWDINSGPSAESNDQAGQVEVFDERGKPIAKLDVLQPVEGASTVSIYDVSAQPGHVIAVAAVYTRKKGDRNVPAAAALLLFDFNGRVRSAFSLPPAREIRRLAVDRNSNIWTLTNNFSGTDPSNVPMIVEYAPDGAVVREMLPHGVLWSTGSSPRESMADGIINMGYSSGVVWLWLPGSTDLVTISTADGRLTRVQTRLPKREMYTLVPLDIARESSGEVVGIFREDGDNGGYDLAYYAWSPPATSWSRFNAGACDGERLLGVDDATQIYSDREGNLCSLQTH